MKKVSLYLLILLFAIMLVGCSGARRTSEKQIKQDVENDHLWEELNVETTSFTVEKRQTNRETKEDIVYIKMTGENKDDGYEAEQYYVAKYSLYDEGWILESLDRDYDLHISTVTPTRGVDISQVQDVIDSFSFSNYSSFDALDIELSSTPVQSEQYLSGDYSEEVYTINCTYYYDLFTEIVEFPIVFFFASNDPAAGYGWYGAIDWDNAVRTLELNEGIIGDWEDSGWESPFYANISFSKLDGNTCYCEFASYTYNGSRYITGTKNYSGTVTLKYKIDEDTGKISSWSPALVFDSDDGSFGIAAGGQYLTMGAKSWNSGRGYVTSHRDLEFRKTSAVTFVD